MPFAQVAIPTLLNRLFTYRVPENFEKRLKVGVRVVVPFRNKRRIGFFWGKTGELPSGLSEEKLKEIEEVKDLNPVFSEKMISFIEWLSDYYVAPIGEICRSALPNRLLQLKTPLEPRPKSLREKQDTFHQPDPFQPTREQQKALDHLLSSLNEKEKKPVLLHGVTGSGKTEIYLQFLSELLRQGCDAILLVPEIGLTPQLIGRVESRIKREIAVYHSGLTETSRHFYWEKIRKGEVKIAIGTRSALFAPFQNLKAIIVDEEQDSSYKQGEGNFHYHARDSAVVRGKLEGAQVLLGSATPSLETFHNAKKGKYHYIVLKERATGASLPEVFLIDLKKTRFLTGSKTLSPPLKEALSENLYRGEQSLLLLNRRGFANFLLCQDCGEVLRCPNCDISLTYHKRPHHLLCHYCDYKTPLPEKCADCKSGALTLLGQGTELLEEELRGFFPQASINRLDQDTARKKGHRERVLHEMKRGKVDILLGTQIVAKGHDFPNVTLVGIVMADASLNLPDFRAAEKTFQLLTQAGGRSGRDKKRGKVLIQTFHPEHFAFLCAREHNFETFSSEELRNRLDLNYPPFSRLAQIRLQGSLESRVEKSAEDLLKYLKAAGGSITPRDLAILGPAKSPLAKIRGKHRRQVLIKARDVRVLKHILKQTRNWEKNLPPAVQLQIDVDCLDLM